MKIYTFLLTKNKKTDILSWAIEISSTYELTDFVIAVRVAAVRRKKHCHDWGKDLGDYVEDEKNININLTVDDIRLLKKDPSFITQEIEKRWVEIKTGKGFESLLVTDTLQILSESEVSVEKVLMQAEIIFPILTNFSNI